MKYSLLSICALLCFFITSAQTKIPVNVRFNTKMDTLVERIYKVPKQDKKGKRATVVLNMAYGDSRILNSEDAKELSEGMCNVSAIDLVYTDDENQELLEKLNKRRLFELYLLAPDVFNQSMVEWRYVKQMGYSKPGDASKLFHGFVIHYKKIKRYEPLSEKSLKENVINLSAHIEDSTILKTLNRHPEWSKELIVADFTGSMSPYYTEMLAWFYLRKFDKKTSFALFNDGDSKSDDKKVMGNTGGVYTFTTNQMDTLLYYTYKTIKGGSGGDAPENDIEAIMKGVTLNNSVKEIILIADNWADMRDYSMMSFVNKPVRVVLCGTESSINPQYLDLARSTKGSVHTMEDDITDLIKLREGEEIEIKGKKYMIRNGRFAKK